MLLSSFFVSFRRPYHKNIGRPFVASANQAVGNAIPSTEMMSAIAETQQHGSFGRQQPVLINAAKPTNANATLFIFYLL